MNKSFFDVFPTLKIEAGLREQLSGVEVTKVATNRDRDYLKIHLFSRHLIQKEYIDSVEKMIRNQLFARSPVRIMVIEDGKIKALGDREEILPTLLDSGDSGDSCVCMERED